MNEQIKKYDYIVIGGGLSGLGFANNMKNTLIIEKNKLLGGHASSFKFKDFSFDFGAHICHSKSEDWLASLNLDVCVNHAKSDVANYDGGTWVGYPVQNNLKDIPVEKRNRAYAEISNNLVESKIDTSSYLNWCNSVYGETLTENYYRRFTDKYWRTPMEEMSASWLSGRLLPINKELVDIGLVKKAESQAVFNSYKYPKEGGFDALFKPLYEVPKDIILDDEVIEIDLQAKKVKLRSGQIFEYSKLVNTIPLTDVVGIIKEVPSHVLSSASRLRYLNLIVTSVIIPDMDADTFPDWFYVYDENIDVSRVTNICKVTESYNKSLALQLETFRRDDEKYDLTDTYESIREAIKKLTNRDLKDIEVEHRFCKYSYVVPVLETNFNRDKILQYLENNDILSCGLYGTWEYMWSDKAYASGMNLAEKENLKL